MRSYGHACHANQDAYLARCRKVLGIAEPEDDSLPAVDLVDSDPFESRDREPVEFSDFANVEDENGLIVEDENGFEIDIFRGVSQKCPKCGAKMKCVSFSFRRSWREIMSGPDRPAWYDT